jgi:acetyl-CoA carboxylase biotin carboxylase subunit
VTELVTGVDLVQLQLRIASGEALPFQQKDVAWRGWAMECRICAEDPDNQFIPSPGKIGQLREPSGPGVRLDSGVYPGWTVPLEYDALLAKLVASGSDRNVAIQRLQRALAEYGLTGIRTNINFFLEILNDPDFRAGDISTAFIPDFFARRRPPADPPHQLDVAVALAAVASFQKGRDRGTGTTRAEASRWLNAGRGQLLRQLQS